jgi:hypothetical protein
MKKKYFSKAELLSARRNRQKLKSYVNIVLREHNIERIPIGGCWLWTGTKWNTGYGYFRKNRKIQVAHRYMYALYKGTFDPKLHVLHTCDNPSCVNPEHLFLGTHTDNMKDMTSKGRHRDCKGIKNPNYKHGNYIKHEDMEF